MCASRRHNKEQVLTAVKLRLERVLLGGNCWLSVSSYTCDFSPQVLGGIEPSLYKGDIWYTPIKEEWYYQIEILKLEIGGQSLNLDCKEVSTCHSVVPVGGLGLASQLESAQKVRRCRMSQDSSGTFPVKTQGLVDGDLMHEFQPPQTPWLNGAKLA